MCRLTGAGCHSRIARVSVPRYPRKELAGAGPAVIPGGRDDFAKKSLAVAPVTRSAMAAGSALDGKSGSRSRLHPPDTSPKSSRQIMSATRICETDPVRFTLRTHLLVRDWC